MFEHYLRHSLHLVQKYAWIFVLGRYNKNYIPHLYSALSRCSKRCSSKLTFFFEHFSQKTVHLSEQIMSVDKYLSQV